MALRVFEVVLKQLAFINIILINENVLDSTEYKYT